MNESQNVPGDPHESLGLAQWLDRLVDGEMSDDRQRELLLLLDTQSDGWRRCALTFIEAQTWKRELRGLERNHDLLSTGNRNSGSAAMGVELKRSTSYFASHRVRWLAMAACFVLAFSIGTLTRGFWTTKAVDSPALQTPAEIQVATNAGHSDESSVAGAANDSQIAAGALPVKMQTHTVMLPTSDGTTTQAQQVAMVDGSAADWQAVLARQKPVLSEAEQKTLESTGHLVQQQRAFYPVQLEDGRQAVVPVDVVEVCDTSPWQ